MAVTIQVRRDTAANWVSANPVLHQGEPGLETDTGKTKIGDGSTAWGSLAYSALPLAQLDARYANVFSPMAYGAYGDGSHDDSTAVQAAYAAAAAVNGVVDITGHKFLTTSPITLSSWTTTRGAGIGYSTIPGSITNTTSDLFSVTGTVEGVAFDGGYYSASAGHVFNAATASCAFWTFRKVTLNQGGNFCIWYTSGAGLYLDMDVGDGCYLTAYSGATTAPWYVSVSTGGANCSRWHNIRISNNLNTSVPFFHLENTSAGYADNNSFRDITAEQCTGGIITALGASHLAIENVAGYDTPAYTGHVFNIGQGSGSGLNSRIVSIRDSGWAGASLAAPGWTATTFYAAGAYVQPTSWNGHIYKCTVAGTSGGTQPTWITTGPPNTQTDGTVTWEDLGSGFAQTVYDVSAPSVVGLILENVGPQSTGFSPVYSVRSDAAILGVAGASFAPAASSGWAPADSGWLAQAYDPVLIISNTAAITAGTIYLTRVNVRAAMSVTNVILFISTGGSGLTSGENYAGLYNSTGTLIAATADQTSAWAANANTFHAMALASGPYSLAAGFYWVAILSNGTTPPKVGYCEAFQAPQANPGLTAATARFAATSLATTVAAGSNGGEISAIASWSSPAAGVLDVASSSGYPSSGSLAVAASGSTVALITYTGTGTGTFTGCAYVSGSATGTVATGGAVTTPSLPSAITPSANTMIGDTYWAGLS